MKNELELARGAAADDSLETLRTLASLGILDEARLLAKAGKRPDVLKAVALARTDAAPPGGPLLETALAASPDDQALLALRALELTGSNEGAAAQQLDLLTNLSGPAAGIAAKAAAALFRCDRVRELLASATAHFESTRQSKDDVEALCAIREARPPAACMTAYATLQRALQFSKPGLEAAHRLVGGGLRYRVRVTLSVAGDGSIESLVATTEPSNPVLDALVARVIRRRGLADICPKREPRRIESTLELGP
ncbi:MAG: hypothetical protein JNK82_40395 [Myxococcaceae bacterium]|nr:hypothetical protein [Myxococcaceae bacterium]